MKKVSVIIPCHNVSKWLPQCFLSLVRQTIGIDNIELIFVDDASDDNGATWKLLTECERAFPESIIIIHLDENMRQGGARNEGLRYASGEYIAFVDSDDFVSEDFLEKTYSRAKETDADIVQFDFQYYINDNTIIPAKSECKNEVIHLSSSVERKQFLVSDNMACGCCSKLYRRSMITSAGVKFAEHVCYEKPLFVYPLFFLCRYNHIHGWKLLFLQAEWKRYHAYGNDRPGNSENAYVCSA